MTWKRFPSYWPFVRGIHRWPSYKGPVAQNFDIFFHFETKQTVEQAAEPPAIWDVEALIWREAVMISYRERLKSSVKAMPTIHTNMLVSTSMHYLNSKNKFKHAYSK